MLYMMVERAGHGGYAIWLPMLAMLVGCLSVLLMPAGYSGWLARYALETGWLSKRDKVDGWLCSLDINVVVFLYLMAAYLTRHADCLFMLAGWL
jgi:hypothetical protein